MSYRVKIGMEVHVELRTNSKMFCGCPAEHFGVEPNTHTCPVCLGLPGALPVPNRKAIDWCIMIGLVLGCRIRERSTFDRKHYFYPDLPKGFQISQYDDPFCYEGEMRGVGITRVHMEEDTGKLIHRTVKGEEVSLVDFNRSGVPLVEIVTEPDMVSAEEAVSFVKELQRVVRYLGVSDGDMEKGSMRLEANVSVNEKEAEGGYKVEVKNLNSFKFLEEAVKYEVDRQTNLLEKGGTPEQETRGYDPEKGETYPQRFKETAQDYRYFPEPDIPPVVVSEEKIEELKSELPEMPWDRRERFVKEFGLREVDAAELAKDRIRADYFEETVRAGDGLSPGDIANVIINRRVETDGITPVELAARLLKEKEERLDDAAELVEFVDRALEDGSSAVADYRAGRKEAAGVLVGRVMELTKGRADGRLVKKMIIERLEKDA